eukprot:SAG31_NODE_13310_length_878_cov_0.996149_1_plen_51_part_10
MPWLHMAPVYESFVHIATAALTREDTGSHFMDALIRLGTLPSVLKSSLCDP